MTDITPKKLSTERLKTILAGLRNNHDVEGYHELANHLSWMDRELSRAIDLIQTKSAMLEVMTNRAAENAQLVDERNDMLMHYRDAYCDLRNQINDGSLVPAKEGLRARIANAFRR